MRAAETYIDGDRTGPCVRSPRRRKEAIVVKFESRASTLLESIHDPLYPRHPFLLFGKD